MNARAAGRAIAAAILVGGMLSAPAVVWAVPSTQVVQGDVLRLVSVADWDAASRLRPGEPVRWDVTVSADAPDPGTVRVGISATGAAALMVDVALCAREWTATGCAEGETVVRTAWTIPRDGSEVPLVEMPDGDVAHLRLSISLTGAQTGSTEVRVHAQGAGESATVGPGGGLAATGVSPTAPWAAGGAIVLLSAGWALAAASRRRTVAGEGA